MVRSMAFGALQTEASLGPVTEQLCAFGQVTNLLGSSVSLSIK